MEEPWENGMGASVFLESSSSFVSASMNTRISGCVYFSSLLFFFVAFVRKTKSQGAWLKADPQQGKLPCSRENLKRDQSRTTSC